MSGWSDYGLENSRTVIAGIDPGASGAVAFLDTKNWTLEVVDTPHEKVEVNGKQRKQVATKPFGALLLDKRLLMISTEKVHAMPKMDVKSIFTFGRFMGQIEMAAVFLTVPHYLATDPSVWKRKMAVPADKVLSRARCIELVPAAASILTRKTDHDRGEAIMLALYGAFSLGLLPKTITLINPPKQGRARKTAA